MHRLIEISEWLLMAVGAVAVLGLVGYAALSLRLKHPPRD